MTSMLKVKVRWTGFTGSPGYSNFYFRDFGAPGEWNPGITDAEAAVARVDTFTGAIKSTLTNGCALQVLGDVEEIEDTTGSLVDIWNVTAPLPSTSIAAAAPYSAASGAVINWRTQIVRNGRRIGGRTFLVPLAGGSMENNGTISAGTLTTLNAAAAALVDQTGTPDLGVWARPTKTEVSPGVFESNNDGTWAVCTGRSIPDMAAVLRSRRD